MPLVACLASAHTKLTMHCSSLYLVFSLLLLLAASPRTPSTAAAMTTGKINSLSASEIINRLNLAPHPEKGFFIETYRDSTVDNNNRSYSTAIYYLLEGRDNVSHWHRVDATEVWHYYAGAPLTLELAYPTNASSDLNSKYDLKQKTLGQQIFQNQEPQVVIDKHVWQRARSLGDWTLVGCTVAPAFVDSGFEMSPPGWEPNQ